MKPIFHNSKLVYIFFSITLFVGCVEKSEQLADEKSENSKAVKIAETPKKPLSSDFKSYWYAGEAELTSYTLEQARYGELRDGKAVLIYVTEPFLPEKQVKANGQNPENVSVLKLIC